MKINYKKIIFLVVISLVFFGAVYFFFSKENKKVVDSDKTKVVVTIFPLYDMARAIGGDKIDLIQLLPPGVEAHSFEPTPSDMIKIDQSNLFVYAGPAMEPWAEDIVGSGGRKNRMILSSSAGIEMIEDDDEHGGLDPHIWLDFDNAKHMAASIAAALSSVDPEDAAYFQDNLSQYEDGLAALDVSYRSALSDCDSYTIVYGGHYAFGYLAKRYNLEYMAAQGLSPDAEPSPEDLISLVNQIRDNGIKYVFYEELASPKIAETISFETGAKMLLLNAAHNLSREDLDSEKTFFSIMEENLINLKQGLSCR